MSGGWQVASAAAADGERWTREGQRGNSHAKRCLQLQERMAEGREDQAIRVLKLPSQECVERVELVQVEDRFTVALHLKNEVCVRLPPEHLD